MKPIERVLVIDDDAISILLTKRVLSREGIGKQIDTASNGVEGLAHIREAAGQDLLPHLVLLDIKMPVMDGFELLDELDKLKVNLADTKIVLLSSSQSPKDRERAARSQAAAFLHKPLTKEKLRDIIK